MLTEEEVKKKKQCGKLFVLLNATYRKLNVNQLKC